MIFRCSKTVALSFFRERTIRRFGTNKRIFWWRRKVVFFLYFRYNCLYDALFFEQDIGREFEIGIVIHTSKHQHDMIPPCLRLEFLFHHLVKVIQDSQYTLSNNKKEKRISFHNQLLFIQLTYLLVGELH